MADELKMKDHGHRGHHAGRGHDKDKRGKRHYQIDASIKPGSAKYIWIKISHNKGAVFGMAFLALIIILSLLSPYICRYSYSAADFANPKAWPSMQHLFGTDDLGRDISAA